jgi:anti-anti-sigma factor
MILRFRKYENVIFIDVERSVIGSDGYRLYATYRDLLDANPEDTHFVFNLQRTHSMDSFAMGALVRIYVETAEEHGSTRVCLVNPNPNLARLFELAHVTRLYEQFPTERAAIRWVLHASKETSETERNLPPFLRHDYVGTKSPQPSPTV